MGSMGLADPINCERRVLESINIWGNSIETHIDLAPLYGARRDTDFSKQEIKV